jgi:hypothetical protein
MSVEDKETAVLSLPPCLYVFVSETGNYAVGNMDWGRSRYDSDQKILWHQLWCRKKQLEKETAAVINKPEPMFYRRTRLLTNRTDHLFVSLDPSYSFDYVRTNEDRL